MRFSFVATLNKDMSAISEAEWDTDIIRSFYEDFGFDFNSLDEFSIPIMNPYQASTLNTDQSIKNFISSNLPSKGEQEVLRGVFELYEYWHQNGNAPNVPKVLFHYFIEQESTTGSNLDLQEIQAGLAFKHRIHLWKEFLEIATDPKSYPTLDDDLSRKCLRDSRAMKVSLLRREEKFNEAQDLLSETLKIVEADAARGDTLDNRLGVYYYEAGYLSFIAGDWDEAINYFGLSSDMDAAQSIEVGYAISLCLEFRVRYTLGRVSVTEFSDLLLRMVKIFEQNSADHIPRHGHARRWVVNCWVHILEISVDSMNCDLADIAIKEIRPRLSLMPDESFGFLYEGMYYLTHLNFVDAADNLERAWNFRTENGDPARFKAPESKSHIPYLLGKCYELMNDVERSRDWLRIAADAPSQPGNHFWKERGKAALRLLR